ncbi:hypothetical protein [Phyllobacterium sp. P30BS-XVII]|uniref:hypothetical protein n=1 Tax=Phyllobacterium sp. P30BS-XVII TaxID=2587046 RepID=UPI000DDEA3CF|nr:hypothetical protein [Phyllobacterium sp. P30BS-XVII]MBA8901253.1 hypothetical protein [Phyllobacterium sp. P30BS-XVII]
MTSMSLRHPKRAATNHFNEVEIITKPWLVLSQLVDKKNDFNVGEKHDSAWEIRFDQAMRAPAIIKIIISPASKGRMETLAWVGSGFNTNLAKSAALLPQFL